MSVTIIYNYLTLNYVIGNLFDVSKTWACITYKLHVRIHVIIVCLQPIRSDEEKLLLIYILHNIDFFLEIQAPGSNMLKSFRITACDVG